MSGEKDLQQLLIGLTPYLLPQPLVYCSVAGELADYLSLQPIATCSEAEGLSLLLPLNQAQQAGLPHSAPLQMISLHIHSSLEAVGLTAAIASQLARFGISANVIAAYYHDHVLVPSQDAQRALEALIALSQQAAAALQPLRHKPRIISGGQTGVDRAALDVALKLGLACGGWCPQGRLAEDGVLPEHYPLQQLAGAGYAQRNRRNVQDSDATALVYFERLSGGTELTLKYAINLHRPYLLIDGSVVTPTVAAKQLRQFLNQQQIKTLNVAGPRHSRCPSAYDYCYQLLMQTLAE